MIRSLFDRVYPDIKNQEQGVLIRIVYLILEKSQLQFDAKELCDKYNIKDNSSLDEDLKIFEDIFTDILKINREDKVFKGLIETLKSLLSSISIYQQVTNKHYGNEGKMKLIFLVAIILIGVYVIKKALSKDKERLKKTYVPATKSIPTAICLAVPASVIYGLNSGDIINTERIIQLIAAASEFLCLKVEEANDEISETIDIINQEISPESQLKFYIRIDIPNGQEIINKESKYVIKRDFPQGTEGQIKQLGRLRDVSILTKFNHV